MPHGTGCLMLSGNPVTAYIVLGLSNLLGGVTKGVTGFGSAILNLCTWIVFVVAGVESGSLQQAVVCEALSSTLVAPWLLYATRAHATADFKTVVAISIFVALSSPLGAAVLAKLNAKRVELVMATLLLLIIVAEQLSKHVLSRCRRQQHGSSSTRAAASRRRHQQQRQRQEEYSITTEAGADAAPGAAATPSSLSCQLSECSGSPPDQFISVASSPLLASPLAPLLASSDAAAAAAADYADCTGMFQADGGTVPPASALGPKYSSNNSMQADAVGQYAEHDAVVTFADVAAPAQDQGHQHTRDDEEAKQHLLHSNSTTSSASGRSAAIAGGSSSSGRHEPGARSTPSSSQRQAAKAWCVVLGIGSLAGTLSGVMEGLTGMNGPPIMFMYRWLNTPKATVRGNNAFLNLLQMRLVPYWYMGLIVLQDLQLYAVSCAAAAVGVVLGDQLSKHIDQQAFQRVLGLLMVLCCALMFASGLGLVE